MIDLHTHTTESDGTFTPSQLVLAAHKIGLEAIAITDHDTFAGYDSAVTFAASLGVDMVCGIELSAKFRNQSVHVLGYFLESEPSKQMRLWVHQLQQKRHSRNARLIERLCSYGLEITANEVYERGGKLPGRPHFAALLTDKGYVTSPQQAFDRYLGEEGACFVQREEPSLAESIKRISEAGGLSSLAHPIRVTRQYSQLKNLVLEMKEEGLDGLEVYHSENYSKDTDILLSLATANGFAITGGSDFHGATKPSVQLGTGVDGRMNVPAQVLKDLPKNRDNFRPAAVTPNT